MSYQVANYLCSEFIEIENNEEPLMNFYSVDELRMKSIVELSEQFKRDFQKL